MLQILDEDGAKKAKPVPAIVRTKMLLDALSGSAKPKGVSELSRDLALPKSTVHGLCHTLADLGLLLKVGPAQYAMGPHVLAWANAFEGQSDVTQEFMRLAEADVSVPDRAINLSILAGKEVMYVACRRGTDPLGVSFRPGVRLPAPFTATGKAMMSTMQADSVRKLFESGWPDPWTRKSVRSLDAFLSELEDVRTRGYSIDDGQLRDAMVCFGAPVFGAVDEQAVAGIAIGVLAGELDDGIAAVVSDAVRSLAASLSHRLGSRNSRWR